MQPVHARRAQQGAALKFASLIDSDAAQAERMGSTHSPPGHRRGRHPAALGTGGVGLGPLGRARVCEPQLAAPRASGEGSAPSHGFNLLACM